MAFIVEDGTGQADANAYIDATYFDTYHGDRGRDVGQLSATQKQQVIVKATDYVEKRFRRRFIGFRQFKHQALHFPALNAFDQDGYLYSGETVIPPSLQKGVAEYAWIIWNLVGKELLPTPATQYATQDNTGAVTSGTAQVTFQKKQVGPIGTSTGYADFHSQKSTAAIPSSVVDALYIPPYPAADLWIEDLLKSSTSVRLRRA